MYKGVIKWIERVAILLPIILLYGCGGNHNPEDPIEPPIDVGEILKQEHLVVYLGSDKTDYEKGEPIRFWLSVRNDGPTARLLELHPRWDQAGDRTYSGGLFYYDPSGSYPGVWGSESDDIIAQQVPSNAEIRLVELTWDQRLPDGASAKAGYYDAGIGIDNLYVDGQKLAELPTFEVTAWKQISIQE